MIDFLQYCVNQTTSAPPTLAASFSADTVAGNLLMVFVSDYNSSDTQSVADTQGNSYTRVQNNHGSDGQLSTWIAENIVGGPNTVTVTTVFGVNSIVACEFSGALLSGAFDTAAYFNGTSSTSGQTVGPLTVGAANEYLVLLAIDGNNDTLSAAGFDSQLAFWTPSYGWMNELWLAAAPGAGDPASATVVSDNNGNPTQLVLVALVANNDFGVTSDCPDGVVGTPYTGSVTASGGTAPYAYAITAGALPTGLSLDASTGDITGTPTATGTNTATITASDSASHSAPITPDFTIAPEPTELTITADTPNGEVGTAYTGSVTAAGGATPYSYAVTSGSLPTGLALNTSTGAITGTPSVTGPNTATITATDSTSPTPQTAPIEPSFTILAALAITIETPIGFIDNTYTVAPTVTGGVTPYTFSLSSGSLPPGLALNTSTGVISGAPTEAGLFPSVLEVTDADDATATVALDITVNNYATISPLSNVVTDMAAKCLPEGLRLYTVTLDFSSIPGTPMPTQPPYLNFPELTINDNSADGPGHDDSLNSYQVVLLKPGNQTQPSARGQAIGLSCIRALQFYYRATFGYDGAHNGQGGADFAVTPFEMGLLLVTNLSTGQTVCVPQAPYTSSLNGNPIVNGAMPFYAGPDDTIRVLKLNEGANNAGYGKVTLQFANFDIAPFVSASQGTLDTNT